MVKSTKDDKVNDFEEDAAIERVLSENVQHEENDHYDRLDVLERKVNYIIEQLVSMGHPIPDFENDVLVSPK